VRSRQGTEPHSLVVETLLTVEIHFAVENHNAHIRGGIVGAILRLLSIHSTDICSGDKVGVRCYFVLAASENFHPVNWRLSAICTIASI
jgi:hypothetical protein